MSDAKLSFPWNILGDPRDCVEVGPNGVRVRCGGVWSPPPPDDDPKGRILPHPSVAILARAKETEGGKE